MAIEVKINNVSIQYPQIGDTEWGNNATNFAIQTATAFNAIGLSNGTTVDLPGTLDVTGNTTLDSNLAVGGTLGVTGNVAINTNKFNVTASTGNTTIAGTLGISNGTALSPAITPSGDTNTGLYSIGADKIGFSANGVRQGEFGVGYGGFTGNIIQVVSSTQNFQTNITGTAFQNLNSASGVIWETAITPKFANSKIFVLFTLQASPPANDFMGFRLSSKINAGSYSVVYNPQIVSGSGAIDIGSSTSGGYVILTRPILYTPTYSPGDTITHKIEGSCYSTATTGSVNTLRTGTGANNGHSEIFLFEIAG